jgi:hypothetical protein
VSVLAFLALAQVIVASRDATTLFNSVCLSDQASLSQKDFAEAKYSDLPESARKALGFAISAGPVPFGGGRPLPVSEVPNQVLRQLPGKNTFLLLPAPQASGAAAPVCAIVWRGNHYPEAQKAARAIVQNALPKDARPLGTNIPGFNFELIHANGAVVGAAEFMGWTVLRAAPDNSPEEGGKN